jgi:hypothetical protein
MSGTQDLFLYTLWRHGGSGGTCGGGWASLRLGLLTPGERAPGTTGRPYCRELKHGSSVVHSVAVPARRMANSE